MGRAAWLVALACAGCANTTSNFCDDGTVCPGGFTCDVTNHRCLLPEQTAACNGKQEADACDVSGAPGACRSGACEVFYCGDGYVTEGEDCDGDDLAGADCKSFGYYGTEGLRCSDSCTYDQAVCRQENEYCGDGTVNGPELCDGAEVRTCASLGFDAGTASCDLQCTFTILDCSRFGWNPESLSDVMAFAVAGSSRNDQWAVGGDGRTMRFEGLAWNTVPTPVHNTLIRAWANTPADAWAVGQSRANPPLPSVVIHWDGGAWSEVAGVPADEYIDIWGTGPEAMWVATPSRVLAYDGTTWTPVGTLTGTPIALRGTGSDDLWVATQEGPLLHWKGAGWITTDSPAGANIQFIDANAPDDVWAIGYATADQGTAIIAHYDGTTWRQWVEPQEHENVIASSGPEDAWVGGVDGIMRHWDGISWSNSVNIGASPSGLTALSGLISFGPGDVVGVSTLYLAYRYRGQTFGTLPTLGPNPFDATPSTAIWGTETSLFVTNFHGEIWHFDGDTWSPSTTLPQSGTNQANDVWGFAPDDVYVAADDGKLYHYDGTTWTSEQVATGKLTHVWGSGPGNVWAFGGGLAFHKAGGTWVSDTLSGNNVLSASGTGPNDVWAVTGTPNQLWHWDGSAWAAVPTGATTDPLAVAAVAPDDVHVSATQSRMLHFNGSTWSEVVVPTLADITFLEFTAADDVVAASERDLLHYDGQSWSNMRTPVDFVPNTSDYIPIKGLSVHPARIDILLDRYRIRTLVRSRPLKCRATETCGDGVDNDCDDQLDSVDPECP